MTAERLQGTANVRVDITNVNDNIPMFSFTTYEFQVEEEASPSPLTTVTPPGLSEITVCPPTHLTYLVSTSSGGHDLEPPRYHSL